MMVDADTCLGADACGACRAACPYGAPQFGPEPDAKMQMCTMCHDRLDNGEHPYALGPVPCARLTAETWRSCKRNTAAAARPAVFATVLRRIRPS